MADMRESTFTQLRNHAKIFFDAIAPAPVGKALTNDIGRI